MKSGEDEHYVPLNNLYKTVYVLCTLCIQTMFHVLRQIFVKSKKIFKIFS